MQCKIRQIKKCTCTMTLAPDLDDQGHILALSYSTDKGGKLPVLAPGQP